MNTFFCPQCQVLSLKSSVRLNLSTNTLLNYHRFYDDQGRHHFHDENIGGTTYRCSNGHTGVLSSIGDCWCEYQQRRVHMVAIQNKSR
jgi:hypothetical protein